MFGNTGKQIKTAVKEVFGIFKAIGNDIRQEVDIQKKLASYRKELLSKEPSSKPDDTRAHEEPKS